MKLYSTDPRDYLDQTCPCPKPHLPTRLVLDKNGFLAHYDCPTDGHYTVGWMGKPVRRNKAGRVRGPMENRAPVGTKNKFGRTRGPLSA